MKIYKIKILFTLLFLINSCSYGLPLQTTYKSPSSNIYLKTVKPSSVNIKEFKDVRKTNNFNDIGKINEVVADITSSNLILDKPASIIILNALKNEFLQSGFTLKQSGGADYTLKGEIKKFSLDIEERDHVVIEIDYEFTSNIDKKTIYSGSALVQDSRFAGVTGNTRKSIKKYLNKALSNLSAQIISSTGLTLKTKIEVPRKTKEIAPEPTPHQIGKTKTPPPSHSGGTLIVSGTPLKVKIYIEDVYYGLTPLSINIKSGVYNVSFKKKGFKTEKEKVSIREGAETILEIDLQRQG